MTLTDNQKSLIQSLIDEEIQRKMNVGEVFYLYNLLSDPVFTRQEIRRLLGTKRLEYQQSIDDEPSRSVDRVSTMTVLRDEVDDALTKV